MKHCRKVNSKINIPPSMIKVTLYNTQLKVLMLPPLKYSRLCGNDIALYAALLPHSWESRKVIAEFPIEAQ